jgi:hypothetical protein
MNHTTHHFPETDVEACDYLLRCGYTIENGIITVPCQFKGQPLPPEHNRLVTYLFTEWDYMVIDDDSCP